MQMPTLILLVINIAIAVAQIPQPSTILDPCSSKLTCHDCIQTPSCAWCYDKNYTSGPRCFTPSYPIPPKDQCDEKYVHNPDNIMSVIKNVALSHSRVHGGAGASGIGGSTSAHEESGIYSGGGGGGGGIGFGEAGGITQIAPQRIQLKLRAKQSYMIQMHYTQAEDYPVDLYYLMDLSNSMKDDKDKLSALGDHLVQTMQNITTKFTLGFGSFVDKVVMPYVSTLPEKLLHPCGDCAAPYGFRNHMALSNNTYRFSQMVRDAPVSGNLDAPEGGFDAIMQAVVCRRVIQWREQARRLLVFSTDAGFHYAGDGKLGGIVKPNDGKCHLNADGYYTMSSEQDYPSISQISTYVKNNAINIIFAVTADQIGVYQQLQEHIEGATCAKLLNDSSNIVDLIKEQYEQISSTIEIKHNASSDVNVRVFTKCLNEDGLPAETNKCGNIKVGSAIVFDIMLEVIKCPRDPKDWHQTIKIYPVAMNESLIIDLEMLCSCPCEDPTHIDYQKNSPVCHGSGTYRCGICECNSDSFGLTCECKSNDVLNLNQTANCISPLNNLECSGRGSCICGECHCHSRLNENEMIKGTYCECDNFSCERHNGLLCSGHGTCNCGLCDCQPGWTGDNCACLASNSTCFTLIGEYCSGHGYCECGTCKCNTTANGRRFSGKFCEQDPDRPDRCEEFRKCVQCKVYKTGPFTEKECNTCLWNYTIVDKIEIKEENNEVFCSYSDEDGCDFNYVYYHKEDKTIGIRAQKERKCKPPVHTFGIVMGVIAAVVLMGLAIILLWKLLTTIHDRREFAKFEKERMMAKWDTGENPIYKQATSTFKNPTYAGKG